MNSSEQKQAVDVKGAIETNIPSISDGGAGDDRKSKMTKMMSARKEKKERNRKNLEKALARRKELAEMRKEGVDSDGEMKMEDVKNKAPEPEDFKVEIDVPEDIKKEAPESDGVKKAAPKPEDVAIVMKRKSNNIQVALAAKRAKKEANVERLRIAREKRREEMEDLKKEDKSGIGEE